MEEKIDLEETNRPPRHLLRRDYYKNYSRVKRHLDWFLKKCLERDHKEKWSLGEIEDALQEETGIRMDRDKIRTYNAYQFLRYEVSPLRRVSDSEYTLNHDYYELLGELVSEPGKAKTGPRYKSAFKSPIMSSVKLYHL